MNLAKKLLLFFSALFIIALLAFFVYFFVPLPFLSKKSTEQAISPWGVDFSQSQAEYLKLNWKEAYSAIINDLGAKNIKLHTNWNWVEGIKDNYFFNDTDWQIKQAEEKNVKIVYVIGMKTGRWPECHMPDWTNGLSEKKPAVRIVKIYYRGCTKIQKIKIHHQLAG